MNLFQQMKLERIIKRVLLIIVFVLLFPVAIVIAMAKNSK